MSASEWSRLQEERDSAVYYLRRLVNTLASSDGGWGEIVSAARDAESWLNEEIGEEEDE